MVFFRNVILDPAYLDMVLYLLSSAQYNSISYKLESFLWMKRPVITTSVDSHTPDATIVSLVPNDGRVSRIMQSSYQCALVLRSEVSTDSQYLGHKTDLYNISKLRSFIYTSLNVFSIGNVDIIARARWFTLLLHDSPFNDMEIAVRADQAVAACFLETAPDVSASGPPLRASEKADTPCAIHSYIQHGRHGRPSVIATEIRIKSRFCPIATQLQCMSKYVGVLAIREKVQCVADLDILFTSLNPAHVLATFQHYIEDIQVFDRDMQLQQPTPCEPIVHIRHRAIATDYAGIVHKQQLLSDLHSQYQRHFQSDIVFDSGVNALVTYNITMKVGMSRHVVSSNTMQATNAIREQAEQKTRMMHVLALLSVKISVDDISSFSSMSLREDDENTHDVGHGDSAVRGVVFSLAGVIISAADVLTLTNTTIFLSTSRFADAGAVTLTKFSSSISGTLRFDALSVSDAQRLYAHIQEYAAYFNIDSMVFRVIVTQRFMIPHHLFEQGVKIQSDMHYQISRSVYVLRVSLSIPVEASLLNPLLVEVFKLVIFNKISSKIVRLVSVASQVVPAHDISGYGEISLETTPYSQIVYEIQVEDMDRCTIDRHSNTDDYYTELGSVVSSIFGFDIAIQLHGICLVTNTLLPTMVTPQTPLCVPVLNNSMWSGDVLQRNFFNSHSVAYTETCVLQTAVRVSAQFDHLTDIRLHPAGVARLLKALDFDGQDSLTCAMQATLQLRNSATDPRDLVRIFTGLYAPNRASSDVASSSIISAGTTVLSFEHVTTSTSVRTILASAVAYTTRGNTWHAGDVVTIFVAGIRGQNPAVLRYMPGGTWSPVNTDPMHEENAVYVIQTPRADRQGAIMILDKAISVTRSIFALNNDGITADEKSGCTLADTLLLPLACDQTFSVSPTLGPVTGGLAGCVRFIAQNNRIDINILKHIIMTKTTPDMVETRGIGIYNQLDAYVDSIDCTGGFIGLVDALLQMNPNTTNLRVASKHTIQLTLTIQHVTPFTHIPEYLNNVLLLLHEEETKLQRHNIETTAVLHLYTKGVAYGTAMTFFQITMREYIISRLLSDTDVQLQIIQIEQILQYGPVFPNTLFETDEDLVQLYIQVDVSGMRDCSEIQVMVAENIIHRSFYGMDMQVTVIDTIDTPITCNNTVFLEYNSVSCTKVPESPYLPGKRVAGGTIIHSNSTCLSGEGGECFAHLSSTEIGLFYSLLQMITSQIDPLLFHFRHTVDFCGLNAALLMPLISKESLIDYGAFNTLCLLFLFYLNFRARRRSAGEISSIMLVDQSV